MYKLNFFLPRFVDVLCCCFVEPAVLASHEHLVQIGTEKRSMDHSDNVRNLYTDVIFCMKYCASILVIIAILYSLNLFDPVIIQNYATIDIEFTLLM